MCTFKRGVHSHVQILTTKRECLAVRGVTNLVAEAFPTKESMRMITVVLGFRVSKALAVASVCLHSYIVLGCLRELSQFVTTRSMAGVGRRRIQRACVFLPPRPAPGAGTFQARCGSFRDLVSVIWGVVESASQTLLTGRNGQVLTN